jgi:hypothetical protein
MPPAKIQLKGQFELDRRAPEALSLQIARQLQAAIEEGRVTGGSFVRSRRGAGIYARAPAVVSGFDIRAVMRAAQFPSRSISLRDPDGNSIRIGY